MLEHELPRLPRPRRTKRPEPVGFIEFEGLTTALCPRCGWYLTLRYNPNRSELACDVCGFAVEFDEFKERWWDAED